jgi:hypothetical protein
MQSYESFTFQGDNYLLSMLKYAKTVKTYWSRDKSICLLVRDECSRLFVYCREEETTFDGNSDWVDMLWVLVTNEREADEIHNNGLLSLSIGRPCICADGKGWMNVFDIPMQ